MKPERGMILSGRQIMARQAGFTLVEMLISSAISLILIAGVLTITLGVMGNSAKNLKRTHLVQELRSSMSLMVRDIRRAGFNGGGVAAFLANGNNPFTQVPYMLNVPGTNSIGSCILYAYDERRGNPPTANGSLDMGPGIDERHGFRLKNGKLEMFSGNNGASYGCNSSGWQRITSSQVKITQLIFDASNEQCFNVSVVPNQLLASCNVVLPPGQLKAKLLIVKISLQGTLASDPNVVRSLHDTVKIRNVQVTG
ncbi:MAG: prepilin-type N-terminal cleavage/methylation domain-containing protein [Gammaproteobacteria bacterium]|nr:MAG: prepilin-type N-terminal cleavage/methylation domain-containing protein [Gammaproteobacteria bacterium]